MLFFKHKVSSTQLENSGRDTERMDRGKRGRDCEGEIRRTKKEEAKEKTMKGGGSDGQEEKRELSC